MQKPEPHKREEERLKELKSFNILDTLPESDYDNLTQLASQICGTPIALISLIDNDRQWFKSKYGIEATETPKDLAFCAHAINEENEILIIEDSRKDIRFFDNPLVVKDPHVIFYAGVPLISENQLPLGTLCIIDNAPKTLNQNQIDSLKNLANQVVNLLKLRKANSQLEQSLLSINKKNKELEHFAYITAHDLQEPLRTITSFIDLFRSTYFESLDDTQKIYFNFISGASTRMSSQIRHLLDYSRLGIINEIETINLNRLIDEVKNDLNNLITSEKAIIESDDLPIVEGYPEELRLLFLNLISNAIKFRTKERAPRIKITTLENEDDWIFCVSDNGIGIEPKHFEKIFAIFQRLHNKEDFEGSGIGLAHCKKIVEIHQGEIWVESELNKGSKFFFSIKKI